MSFSTNGKLERFSEVDVERLRSLARFYGVVLRADKAKFEGTQRREKKKHFQN